MRLDPLDRDQRSGPTRTHPPASMRSMPPTGRCLPCCYVLPPIVDDCTSPRVKWSLGHAVTQLRQCNGESGEDLLQGQVAEVVGLGDRAVGQVPVVGVEPQGKRAILAQRV